MIKLLVLLFICSSVYAQENLFKLPDNHARFLHSLHAAFKGSSEILIISPVFDHRPLSQEILKVLKHGAVLKLIVTDPKGESLSLVQYDHADLYLSPSPLKQTIIVVDHKLGCTTDLPLDEEAFSSLRTLIHCTDDPNRIASLTYTLKPIVRQSAAYLK